MFGKAANTLGDVVNVVASSKNGGTKEGAQRDHIDALVAKKMPQYLKINNWSDSHCTDLLRLRRCGKTVLLTSSLYIHVGINPKHMLHFSYLHHLNASFLLGTDCVSCTWSSPTHLQKYFSPFEPLQKVSALFTQFYGASLKHNQDTKKATFIHSSFLNMWFLIMKF